MRTIKELLPLVINCVAEKHAKGICIAVAMLLGHNEISEEESGLVLRYIRQNKPKNLRENKYHKGYWWKPYAKKCRLQYLNKLLSECET